MAEVSPSPPSTSSVHTVQQQQQQQRQQTPRTSSYSAQQQRDNRRRNSRRPPPTGTTGTTATTTTTTNAGSDANLLISQTHNSSTAGRRGPRPRPARYQSPPAAGAIAPATTSSSSNANLNFTSVTGSRVSNAVPLQQRSSRRERTSHRGKSQTTTVVHGRHFGSSLTTHDAGATNEHVVTSSSLQAEAPEFLPGQPLLAAALQVPGQLKNLPPTRQRRASKSTAPDFATRVHEDISNRQYECAICTIEVLQTSKVWSCHTCWTVFHLDCVKKWSANTDAVNAQELQDGQTNTPRLWRCPGCNLPQSTKPKQYECWCGKELEPRPLPGLPPHSCGQTCGKLRKAPKECPHPCELICHAGPCPPCNHLGPKQLCFCGKESTTRRCVDTDYNSGWSCGHICGDIMPCGEHTCPQTCHMGLCGACEIRVDARCYCGKEQKNLLCCDKDEEKSSAILRSEQDGEFRVEKWTAIFQCTNVCGRLFDCGVHECQKPCHVQDEVPTKCPYSPDLVIRCPCGKSPLDQIQTSPRLSCTDPIPNCEKPCLKMLPCGHECQQICHRGDCMPCMQSVAVRCRCGRTTETIICHQTIDEPPQCGRVCHVTLNCGRHECGQTCCSGERKAADRQSLRKKGRPLNSVRLAPEDGFEAEHICTRICGRLLKCGNHTCQELCHKGQCGSCREAIFEDISCHCGRTVLQPPLPCGTGPPPCRFECERTKDCGHPKVAHNCHSDDQPCPNCPFLMEKVCMCGKRSLKNQQCWFTDVRCGQICGKRLKCGSHACRKTCHKAGECEDASGPCQQPCGKPKKECGHPCEETCHAPYPCRGENPCTHKTMITCDCQTNKQEARCNASRSSPGNTLKSLKCDEECGRLERNRKLAMALSIDPATHQDNHIPYSEETLALFADNATWAQDQEREFRVFANSPPEKRIRFRPMPSHQRAFLHALAEDYGLDSESMDPEPHRHVAIFKTPRFVSAPNKTIRECMRIRQSHSVQQAKSKAVPAVPSGISAKDSYNGFLLSSARFALTLDELQSEIGAILGPTPKLHFEIEFLSKSDSVALQARAPPNVVALPERVVENLLREMKTPISRGLITTNYFGTSLCLARFDESLKILRREDEAENSEGSGWSKVAAKGAAAAAAHPRTVPVQESRQKNTFTVLSTLSSTRRKQQEEAEAAAAAKERERERKRKQKEAEVVADDWELAEQMEEEKEKANEEESAIMAEENTILLEKDTEENMVA